MQLLCSLLTGFFLWLLIYQWRRKSIGRMRRLAGDLVFMTKTAHSRRWLWVLFGYVFVYFLCVVVSTLSTPHAILATQFALAGLFAVVLLLGIPLISSTALEIREFGVLCGKHGNGLSIGKVILVPWDQIESCRWVAGTFVGVPKGDKAHKHLVFALDAIPMEQKEPLIAAAGRFVPVHAYDGTLLAKPEDQHRVAGSISWRDLDVPRFQFDLQTMLLLVVVVATAASLFGMHYRSPHYQAIARLEAFGPTIYYVNDEVWSLDFSACANKPTDDDLACLEPLSELQHLDLAGSPITDAGLVHLRRLKKLRDVTLANTFVTVQAMRDLQEAMPGLSVGAIRYPPMPTPVAVPLPKDKNRR